MKKLALSDIIGPAKYEAVREEMRRAVIETKKKRRVSVGPQVSLVFENHETMSFQVEEMCRAEAITDPAKIQEEIDTYNAVLPEHGALGATLFIEVQSDAALRRTLEAMVGLQEHVWIIVGGSRQRAKFDEGQFTADKLAAVQYVKFPLDAAAQRALRTPGTEVRLAIDHPAYRHEAILDDRARAELATDLD